MKDDKNLSQNVSSRIEADPVWFNRKIRINGREVIPHSSVNAAKLQEQMDRNPDIWETMFRLLESTAFSDQETGRHEAAGEDLFYMINQYTTKEAEKVKFEAHRKYIDLQYMTEGEEMMGVSGFEHGTETETYISEKDIAFYSVSKAEYHKATPSAFFVFFPEDLHQPGVMVNEPQAIKKVVFKILLK
jgi:YhcH/YjgK/YiaL family protein